MAQSSLPSFDQVLHAFVHDHSAASPIPEEANPGLVRERHALCEAYRVSIANELGSAAAPIGPTYTQALHDLIRNVRAASDFVRLQGAATSHIWDNNLFGHLVNQPALATHSRCDG